jgi:hypothetical protein
MNLKQLINKSVYGTIGYISSQEDLDILEQYILYNLPILKEYKQIIIATNYKTYPELAQENTQLWKKYFSDCVIIDSFINRGHNLGTADLDNLIFDYCKENSIEWLCKSANDIIIQPDIFNKIIEEADFYYLCGFGYAGFNSYNIETAIEAIYDTEEFFYPQTNFYFINVSKCDYLNNKKHLNEVFNKIYTSPIPNARIWDYGLTSCEDLLKDCVYRNNLFKYHLIPKEKYFVLLKIVKDWQMHDPSHKNVLIENICHYHFYDVPIITI